MAISPSATSVSRRLMEEDQQVQGVKLTQVQPATSGPTKRKLSATRSQPLSFKQAFGALGLPMLLMLTLCLLWTIWLIFVEVAPNDAANALMGTGGYDSGQFWLIVDTNQHLTYAGVVGLALIALAYVFVILKMLIWRNKVLTPSIIAHVEERLLDTLTNSQFESQTWKNIVGPKYRRGLIFWKDLTSFNGRRRKFWNVYTKVIDLVMQTIILQQLLKRGSPVALVYGFASFLAMNSLSCALNIVTDRFSVLTEIFVYSVFNCFSAVIFPVITLVYCYFDFDFDRRVYMTYLEKLLPGSFERIARMFANQSELALFRVSFDSLRVRSEQDLVVRVGMNLAFCYRLKRLVEVMMWRRQHSWVSGRSQHKGSSDSTPSQHKTPVPKVAAILFVAFSVAIVVVTQQSVSNSRAVCSAFPECVVYAHQQLDGHLCPCLIFIDIDKAPKTYEEWIHPVDAYDKVQALSSSGLLESLQVINRQLLELPESLRLCRNLKTIQLMYTSIQSLPEWTKDFKHLETLHIEGKLGSQNLRELPQDLFSGMPQLVLVHFGVHEALGQFPPLTGVPNLQSLTLAWIFQLHHLPGFNHVQELRRLTISIVPMLEWIPDMAPLRHLVDFTILPGFICCNGFLGTCDLNDSCCRGNPSAGFPAATCLTNATDPSLSVEPYLGSMATRSAFERYASSICIKMPYDAVVIFNIPTKEAVEMCDGIPYKQCHLPGNFTGMCYNTRFQVLSCLIDDTHIAMRRYQIEKGVGPKCDPIQEKWLGCS